MKGYTSRDVAKLLGLTVAQVRGFARDGFLTPGRGRSEEHTSELQSQSNLVCRLLLEKKKKQQADTLVVIYAKRLLDVHGYVNLCVHTVTHLQLATMSFTTPYTDSHTHWTSVFHTCQT